jgi:MFS family permease
VAASTTVSFSQVTSAQRRTLIAAALGWGLDGFDVMLYSNIAVYVMKDLGVTSKALTGLPNTFMLLASGIGGILFGFIADRLGRKTALMLSILTYSVCSLGSGLSTSILVLLFFRFVLGLGMGGEWNTGATLVAETWPTHLRAKAIAIVQSSWAWGLAAAALVAGVVLNWSHNNWRAVFLVGILPALVTLWIRSSVPESEMWEKQSGQSTAHRDLRHSALSTQLAQIGSSGHRVIGSAENLRNPISEQSAHGTPGSSTLSTQQQPGYSPFSRIFAPELRRNAIFLFLMNLFGLFAWWGLFSWMPTYLVLPLEKGGRGLGMMSTTRLLVILNLVGMFPGYLCYGWIADRLGRKRSLMLFTLCAALLIPLYAAARAPVVILIFGALVAFFGTGFFSGSGLIGSEIFPTSVRARALGFTYNGARTLSCIAPYTIGWVGDHKGLSWAFWLCAASFLLTALMATQLPETKGKELE